MQNLIKFVFNGNTELNAESLLCYVCFVLLLSCIASIAESTLNGWRK